MDRVLFWAQMTPQQRGTTIGLFLAAILFFAVGYLILRSKRSR